MDGSIREIILIVVLVLINGYFAAAEIALISARRTSLTQKAEAGSKGAKTALELTSNPTRLLATIQVAITLVGMLASATAAITLAEPLQAWFESVGPEWLASIASGLSVFLVTIVISYLTLVVGELAPKRLGLQQADKVAIAVAGPVSWLATFTAPVVWLLTISTKLVATLLGAGDDKSQEGVTEEEIKLLVTEQGSLLDEEKRMIQEIFALGDTVVREIMVPRVDMMFIEDTLTVSEAARLIHPTGYSRVPVYHDDHDKIIGVVILKDLVIPLSDGREDNPITEFMRTPVFVPETKDLLPMLHEMQTHRNQMAIVVDEYGGTAGIVTMEDIVEEVVGEIADEFDRDTASIIELGPTSWLVEGNLPTEDCIELGVPLDESDEYDTTAGWLLEQLGHIPHTGETYVHKGYTFTVQAMRRKRIARIRIDAPEPNGADDFEELTNDGAEQETV